MAEDLPGLSDTVHKSFNIAENPEITVEANPADDLKAFFNNMLSSGANRLSLGVQSAVDSELSLLGRRHNFAAVQKTVKDAKGAGFKNISLDLMLGIPNQTKESLLYTLEQFFALEPQHISAYMLKIEKGTPFYKNRDLLNLPNEEQTAELYETAVDYLARSGYSQYEISNFALSGFKSRHNLKYWNCDEYLGLGTAAHSFLDGKRFYCPSDIDKFLKSPVYLADGNGGDEREYAMLRLRLNEGIVYKSFFARYGREVSSVFLNKAKALEKHGLTVCTDTATKLTKKGFLLSNSVIGELYENI